PSTKTTFACRPRVESIVQKAGAGLGAGGSAHTTGEGKGEGLTCAPVDVPRSSHLHACLMPVHSLLALPARYKPWRRQHAPTRHARAHAARASATRRSART